MPRIFGVFCALVAASCFELSDEVPSPRVCGTEESEGEPCDDGNPCTAYDACQSRVCRGFSLPEGSPCDDGNACTTGELCSGGSCTGLSVDCGELSTSCRYGLCNPETGACDAVLYPEGAACDDGDLCTLPGTCLLGECAEEAPVDCAHLSGQCTAGVCDTSTGACRQELLPDASACDDNDPCTARDSCSSGVCAGIPLVDGSDCEDGNPCTEEDTCVDGFCFAQPVVNGQLCDDGDDCTALDGCVDGVCTGGIDLCLCESAEDGTTCDDLDLCTEGDSCAGGECRGTRKVCSFVGNDCNQGVCNQRTGACEPRPVLDGTACADGDPCTESDCCSNGVCAGRPVDCSGVEDTCHTSTCDSTTGQCLPVARGDRTLCDDGDACTRGEICLSGQCSGGRELCTPCAGLALGDGCSDASTCTSDDTCAQVGDALVCIGNERDCSELDDGCLAGTCQHDSGTCVQAFAPDLVGCDDSDPCTEGDHCIDGVCSGPAIRICDLEPSACEPEVDNDDVSMATPLSMTPDATVVVRGRISAPGDVDWYAITVGEDEGFTAETLSDCGSRLNTVLSLYDSSGIGLLAVEDDYLDTEWSRIDKFVSDRDATYYLQVAVYAASGTGSYNLRLTPAGVATCDDEADCACAQLTCVAGKCVPAVSKEVEPNSVAAEATPAVLDGEVAGHLGATDVDFYSIPLTAGMPIDIETLELCDAGPVDTQITVYRPDGVSAAAFNDDGDDSMMASLRNFVAAEAGSYYIAVASTNFDSGRYRLAVRDRRCSSDGDCGCIDQVCDAEAGSRGLCVPALSEVEPNGIGQMPTEIAAGERRHGLIMPAGDDDFMTVRLNPGTYDIATLPYCGDTVDTILTVWARDTNALVGRDDDSGEGLLSRIEGFEVSVTRWFTIAVTARGSAVGPYVLVVTPRP